MSQIKNEIITWIKTDRKYSTGLNLYQRHGNNLAFKNMINRYPESPKMFDNLCYELAKVAGINERMLHQMLAKPVIKPQVEKKQEEKSINDMPAEELIRLIDIIDIEELDYFKSLEILKLSDVKPASRKMEDVIDEIRKIKIEKVSKQVPEKIKHTMKLREEFPFLKDKDCPGILKELVADMLTAYDNYTEAHAKLFENISQEEVEDLSKEIVENYLENRQIWEELNHFKENKAMLGKHPLFAWNKRKEEIEEMKEGELVKLRDALKNNIPRTRKLIKEEPVHQETEKRKERLEQFEKELELVNELLKIEQ